MLLKCLCFIILLISISYSDACEDCRRKVEDCQHQLDLKNARGEFDGGGFSHCTELGRLCAETCYKQKINKYESEHRALDRNPRNSVPIYNGSGILDGLPIPDGSGRVYKGTYTPELDNEKEKGYSADEEDCEVRTYDGMCDENF